MCSLRYACLVTQSRQQQWRKPEERHRKRDGEGLPTCPSSPWIHWRLLWMRSVVAHCWGIADCVPVEAYCLGLVGVSYAMHAHRLPWMLQGWKLQQQQQQQQQQQHVKQLQHQRRWRRFPIFIHVQYQLWNLTLYRQLCTCLCCNIIQHNTALYNTV